MDAKLKLFPDSEATGKLTDIYNDVKKTFQIPFVPNFIQAQGSRPDLLEPIWNCLVGLVVQEGKLPRPIKEMVLMAVASSNSCGYCESAHEVFCKAFAVEPETRKQIMHDLGHLRPGRIRDIIQFAQKAGSLPVQLEDSDYEILKGHGVTDEELQEIITIAAWGAFCNIMADSIRVPKDHEFNVALDT